MDRRETITFTAPETNGQDFSNTARTTSGLATYTGPWTKDEVKHLLRRVMFGAPKSDVDYFVGLGFSASITALLNVPGTAPGPPLWSYASSYADPNVAQGTTWINAAQDNQATGYRKRSLVAWWTGLMLNQDRNILEKMTLFWMNHFATEIDSVSYPTYSYKTLALCREMALGNFKAFTKKITLDPGMLRYLNGALNSVTAPDENYGRELQELFTIGKDANGNPYYNQSDVIAAARVLTGYRVNNTTQTSYFDPTRHDPNNKVFSSYYNNTVIAGRTGTNGANELDDMLDMIFLKNEVALNICRKLYRFFIYYEIDAATESNVIQPLAQILRSNQYEIKPVLTALFSSQHFYDQLNRGCIIKAPLDVTIGFCRDFKVVFPTATSNLEALYNLWLKVEQAGETLTQAIGNPPNVAGWPAYYQSPQFHELWINSVTLPLRNQFTDNMLGNGFVSNSIRAKSDVVAYTTTLSNPSDPVLLIQEVIDLHYSEDVSAAVKAYLLNILLSGQSTNDYWTDAWNNYIGAPTNNAFLTIVQTRLSFMYKYLMNLSEYQLS